MQTHKLTVFQGDVGAGVVQGGQEGGRNLPAALAVMGRRPTPESSPAPGWDTGLPGSNSCCDPWQDSTSSGVADKTAFLSGYGSRLLHLSQQGACCDYWAATPIEGGWRQAHHLSRQETNVAQLCNRSFQWTFLLADVEAPIFGVDFLRNFHLMVDLHRCPLVVTETLQGHGEEQQVSTDSESGLLAFLQSNPSPLWAAVGGVLGCLQPGWDFAACQS
jgi:hypothetical protein